MVLLAGSLLQQPGRTTWDTKLDLTADPGRFLTRSLHLWNPEASFGELQNQAYGYLFPQGPFFLVGDLLRAPDWIVQRLWSALLLVLAYEGTRYVARTLGFGPGAGVVAGVVYALSPRLLGSVGVLSGEGLPSALLPWAALPLLAFAAGRTTARQAGLWSGVAVLAMSGVNAAGTLAVLPLPALVVLTQLRRPGGRALAAWWAGGTTLACAWWMAPLLLLGRYSPPFLDFIETSAVTTSTTGWASSVRGADHWVAYYAIGDQAWWPGARILVTEPVVVVLTGLVAAVGLVGLSHRTMPWRGTLLASALLGLLCLSAGSSAVLGSLVDGTVRDLLDGPLAPFRNIHKVDPLVRLPLALGAAHAVRLTTTRWARSRRAGAPWAASPALRRGLVLTASLALVGTGAPLLTGDLRMPGYTAVPSAWAQAADFLADDAEGRALVLPGSGFGLQTWGWTIDEPLQGEARTPWVTRSQVPLVPGPTARYLDTIERRIASGEGSAALADYLARGGISHVVLRRDLDPFFAETVPPARAELALFSSPGLAKVASFGRTGLGDQPLIDVYAVDRKVETVALLDTDDLTPVRGAPDDLLTALESGVLAPETPAVLTAGVADVTEAAGEERGAVVADGYRRVEREFGRVHDAVSQVMSATEPWRSQRPARDFPGPDGVRVATADFVSGVEVTASTSEGYAEQLGAVRPEFGPHAAFDGSRATAWHSGSLRRPDRQWLQLDLTGAETTVNGGVLSVRLDLEPPAARVTRLRVAYDTAEGPVSAVLGVPESGLVLAPVPPADVRRVRLSAVGVTGAESAFGRVMISEVTVPGIEPGRSTVLPAPLRSGDSLALRLDPPRRACLDVGLGPVCDPTGTRPGEDAGRLDRTVQVEEAGEWRVSGTVVAVPGPASAALLEPLDGRARVRTRSVLGDDPAVSGAFAYDGNVGTAWLTPPRGRATLRLRWPRQALVTGISVVGAAGGVTPQTAVLRAGGNRRVVALEYVSEVAPLLAPGRLRITFRRPAGSSGTPMALGEVRIEGMEGLASAPDLGGPTGAACGLGPQVRVDGTVHDTEVSGTIDDVRLGRPLRWAVCDGPVALDAGRHRIVAESSLQFQPVTLGWRPDETTPETGTAPGGPPRTSQVRSWGPALREVQVGAGSASVLRVAENVNDGWEARLDGRRLDPVTIDGWQQGYRVPAGAGGTVTLVYAPDRVYRAGLLVGGLLALLLLVGALASGWRSRHRPDASSGAPGDTASDIPSDSPTGDSPTGDSPTGDSPTGDSPTGGSPTGGWDARRRGVVAAATGAALLVLGGPVAGAGFVVAALRRPGAWALPLGGALVAISGVLSAASSGLVFGRPGVAADAAAAAGVGLLAGAALLERDQRVVVPGRAAVAERLARVRSWARRHHVVLVGVLLVLGQTVLRAVIVSGSYFWQDDFLHLDLARTLGLGRDYLVRDYSGHVEAGSYAVIWLVGRIGDGSFVPAVVVLVLLQALASLLLLVLLRMLFGASPWLLVPFAAYLVTPLGLATATWLAAGLQAFPLQIAMLTALIGLVRHVDTGRARWLVLSVLAHAGGLLFWEKAAVVLPLLLGVEVLVLAARTPWRERLRRLRRRRWFWLAHLAVLGVYVVGYLATTSAGELGTPADRGLGATLQDMLLRTLLPGLFGGPWQVEGAGNTIYPDTAPVLQVLFAGLAVLVVLASVRRAGRAAWAAWLLVICYVAADIGLVLVGRGAYLLLVARDPRYLTDALPVIVIGVCAAFVGGRAATGARVGAARDRPASSARRLVPWGAVVLVLLSGLVTTLRLAPTTQHPRSEAYVRTIAAALEADPGADVLLTPVPVEVAVSVNLESLLRAVGREQRLDRPGETPLQVDPSGRLVETTLIDVDVELTGPEPDCGWRLDAEPRRVAVLPERDDQPRLLRLGYVAGSGGVLHVAVDGLEQAVEITAGLGERYVVVTQQSGPVRAWVSDVRSSVCLDTLARGVPVPAP